MSAVIAAASIASPARADHDEAAAEAALLAQCGGDATCADYFTPSELHVADWQLDYRLDSGSLNATQRTMVDEMADRWNLVSHMSAVHTYTSSTTCWNCSGYRLIWEGDPDDYGTSWNFCDDTVDYLASCTRVENAGGSVHMSDVDTLLIEDWDWIDYVRQDKCETAHVVGVAPFEGLPSVVLAAPQSGIPHSYPSNDRDQRSAMLHAFGHWQVLYLPDSHMQHGDTIMQRRYLDYACQWVVDATAANASDTVYDHPAH